MMTFRRRLLYEENINKLSEEAKTTLLNNTVMDARKRCEKWSSCETFSDIEAEREFCFFLFNQSQKPEIEAKVIEDVYNKLAEQKLNICINQKEQANIYAKVSYERRKALKRNQVCEEVIE